MSYYLEYKKSKKENALLKRQLEIARDKVKTYEQKNNYIPLETDGNIDKENYNNNFLEINNNVLITSCNSITDSKKDIYVFFHICAINNYNEIVKEILDSLISSGIYIKCKKVYYSVAGSLDGINVIKDYDKSNKFELIYFSSEITDVEYPILIKVQEFSKLNNCYILYLHTKGVSLPTDNFRQLWRKRLIQKVIEENNKCVSLLNEGCDISGCGWKEKKNGEDINYNAADFGHFSGNFWWANSNYVSTLPDIRKIWNDSYKLIKKDFLTYRTQCEFWVGMSNHIKVGINGELNKEYSNNIFYEYKKKVENTVDMSLPKNIFTHNSKLLLQLTK